MSGKIALFAGSFDPVTKGHVELIERASRLVDTLYVGIFYNLDKQGMFSIDERKRMLEGAVAHLPNVQLVTSQQELAVTVAQRLGASCLIRGLRGSQDLAYEATLQAYNQDLDPDLETIFLLSSPNYQHLSSSGVRELLAFKQDVSPYVPASVIKELERKYETFKTI